MKMQLGHARFYGFLLSYVGTFRDFGSATGHEDAGLALEGADLFEPETSELRFEI